MIRAFAAATLLLGLFACGGASAPDTDSDGGVADAGAPTSCSPSAALQTVTSAAGAYSISACASATPARGENAFALAVFKAGSTTPIDGLTLAVQPWMPDMGHGSPTTPAVTDIGNGIYQVTDCVFTMGGEWQLRLTITGSSENTASDTAIVQFTID